MSGIVLWVFGVGAMIVAAIRGVDLGLRDLYWAGLLLFLTSMVCLTISCKKE